MSIDWLINPLNTFGQDLLSRNLAIQVIIYSHLVVVPFLPLCALGMTRHLNLSKRTQLVFTALAALVVLNYLYVRLYVLGGVTMPPVTSDMNLPSDSWVGVMISTIAIAIPCLLFAVAVKTTNPTTSTLLHISGWFSIVALFNDLFFAVPAYITGTLLLAVAAVAAFAIALLVGKFIGTHLSVRRRAHAMSNEKTNIKRGNPRHDTSRPPR